MYTSPLLQGLESRWQAHDNTLGWFLGRASHLIKTPQSLQVRKQRLFSLSHQQVELTQVQVHEALEVELADQAWKLPHQAYEGQGLHCQGNELAIWF